jgi:hypothetical protein
LRIRLGPTANAKSSRGPIDEPRRLPPVWADPRVRAPDDSRPTGMSEPAAPRSSRAPDLRPSVPGRTTLPDIPDKAHPVMDASRMTSLQRPGFLHGRGTPARRRTTSQAVRPEHHVDAAERFVGSVPREQVPALARGSIGPLPSRRQGHSVPEQQELVESRGGCRASRWASGWLSQGIARRGRYIRPRQIGALLAHRHPSARRAPCCCRGAGLSRRPPRGHRDQHDYRDRLCGPHERRILVA